jgi:O-antigen/teichoic acid export membrane protein
VLTILLGTGIGQLVVLAVSPVLTRLYTPDEYGVFTVFVAVVSVLGTFTLFRLDAAIPLPRSDRLAASVAWVGIAACTLMSLLIGLLAPVLGPAVADLVNSPALATVWWWVAAATFMVAIDQVLLTWMVREKRYPALGLRNALQGIGQAAGQVGLAWTPIRSVGLLVGWIIGRIAAVGGLFSRGGLLRQGVPRARTMRAAVVRYRRFPLIASWSSLLNSLGQQAPLLVISAYYGSVTIGLLGLTVKVMAAPVVLLGQAVARVFQGEASEAIRDRHRPLRPILMSNVKVLAAISVVMAIVVMVGGPWLFGVIYGAEWEPSGQFARLLAVGYAAQLTVSPVSQILLILERQTRQFLWDATRLVITVGAPLAAAAAGASATVAVTVLSACWVVTYGALLWVCLGAATSHDRAMAYRRVAQPRGNRG